MDGRMLKQSFPSLFTLGNLLCGFLAVVNVMLHTGPAYVVAAWWIIIAALFDTLDGKVARWTNTSSQFGIEFDSLADLVSFGLAPSILFYEYILVEAGMMGRVFAFIFLASGAMRLARFNVSAGTGKKFYFTGMPIPSGAGILASFVLFSENAWGGVANLDFAIALIVVDALATISTFKYNAFPKISFNGALNTVKSTSFLAMILLVILYPDEIFFPLGITYLMSGPVRFLATPAIGHVFNRNNH